MVLYFSNVTLVKETVIEVTNNEIGNNNGDNTSINIGSDGANTVTGTMTTTENGEILIFAGIVVAAIIIGGGIIYACNVLRKSNDNN